MGVTLDRCLPGFQANEVYVLFPQCFLLSLYIYYSGIVIFITPFTFEASDPSIIGFDCFISVIHDDVYRCNAIQGIGKSWLLIEFLFPRLFVEIDCLLIFAFASVVLRCFEEKTGVI